MKKFIPFLSIPVILFAFFSFRTPPTSTEEGCMKCHSEMIDNKFVHPITETGCQFCHEATGEKHPGKTSGFKVTSSYPDMCYMCHDDKNHMENVHSPVSEGDCSVCHDPHSAPNKSLISDYFGENACLDCHYIDTESATTVHGPVMEGDCQNCHDPHQSAFPNQIKKESKELCLSCHSEKIKDGEREIHSIADMLKKGNNIHDPIKNGSCVSCHTPHSGNFPFLLTGKYPVKQYADASVENFELCFQCHDGNILIEASSKTVTNFRNGTTNLHYLHIKGNRGRNCNLCHNTHGAPNKHLLEESVLFGKWQMPMGLELTENGGSCATGCHKRLEYSRVIEPISDDK